MTVLTNVSDTDLALFQHLANPKEVDFTTIRGTIGSAAKRNHSQPLGIVPGTAQNPSPNPHQYQVRVGGGGGNGGGHPHPNNYGGPIQVNVGGGTLGDGHYEREQRPVSSGNHRRSRFNELVQSKLHQQQHHHQPSSGGAGRTAAAAPAMHAQRQPSPYPQHQSQPVPWNDLYPYPEQGGNPRYSAGKGVPSASHYQQAPAPPPPQQQQPQYPPQPYPHPQEQQMPQQPFAHQHAPTPQPAFQFPQPHYQTPPRHQSAPPAAPHAPLEYPMADDEDVRRIKHRLISEINELGNQLKRFKYEFPTRKISLQDSVEELQFEIDEGRNVLDMKSTVASMKQYIPMGFQLLEGLNNKFGPIVPMQGYTDSFLENMSKNEQQYSHLLERVYRRYYRKSSMSLKMEIFMMLVAPFLLYIAKQKFQGSVSKSVPWSGASGPAPEPEPEWFKSETEPSPAMTANSGAPLPNNDIGPMVQPQPQTATTFFPVPMTGPSAQPATNPVVPNIPSSTGRRRGLKPPSQTFPTTQQPLIPVQANVTPAVNQPLNFDINTNVGPNYQIRQPAPEPPQQPPQMQIPVPVAQLQSQSQSQVQPQLPNLQAQTQPSHPPAQPPAQFQVTLRGIPEQYSPAQSQPQSNLQPQPQQQPYAAYNMSAEDLIENGQDDASQPQPPLQYPQSFSHSDVLNVVVPPTPDKSQYAAALPPAVYVSSRLPPIAEEPAEDEDGGDHQQHNNDHEQNEQGESMQENASVREKLAQLQMYQLMQMQQQHEHEHGDGNENQDQDHEQDDGERNEHRYAFDMPLEDLEDVDDIDHE